jgi:hypothetical protein
VVTELGSEDDDPSDPDLAELDSPEADSTAVDSEPSDSPELEPELDSSVLDSAALDSLELDDASLDSSPASELVAVPPSSPLDPLASPLVAALDEPLEDLWLTLVSRAFDDADSAGSWPDASCT